MLSVSIFNKTCPVACCQVAAFSSEPFLDGPQFDSLLLIFPSLLTFSRAEKYFGMITSVLRRSYAVFFKKSSRFQPYRPLNSVPLCLPTEFLIELKDLFLIFGGFHGMNSGLLRDSLNLWGKDLCQYLCKGKDCL